MKTILSILLFPIFYWWRMHERQVLVRCDGGEQPKTEHPFFVEWEKAERERIRQQHIDKWLSDLTSDARGAHD